MSETKSQRDKRMKRISLAGFSSCGWTLPGVALLCCQAAWAQPVQVFTDRAHPVLPGAQDVTVIYLDEVERLENLLSEGLSADPVQAEQQALARLHSAEGQQTQSALESAYAGLAQAWRLGITHVPAVVEGGHVVYGEADIAKAVKRIEAFKAGRRP